LDAAALLALAASAVISYNNSAVVAGPLLSIGLGRRVARIASGATVSIGAISLGWAMRPPPHCGGDSALGAYAAVLVPTLLSTYLGIPFSASIALIGSRVGGDLASRGLDTEWVLWTSALWASSGALVLLLTAVLYRLFRSSASRARRAGPLVAFSRAATVTISLASGVLLGANTLGFLSSLECHRLLWLVSLGGVAASLPGPAMLEGFFRWFSARHISIASIQLSVIASISIATHLGLPLSHTYAIMLAAIGYTASSGMSVFSRKQVSRAAKSWLCSLAIGSAVSYAIEVLRRL